MFGVKFTLFFTAVTDCYGGGQIREHAKCEKWLYTCIYPDEPISTDLLLFLFGSLLINKKNLLQN